LRLNQQFVSFCTAHLPPSSPHFMNTAVVPAPAASVVTVPAGGPLERLAALPVAAKTRLALGVAILVAVLMALALWSRHDEMRVLFANLPDKDAGAVVAQLSQMNVPYRIADGGTAILVPAEQVHETRLKLASAGLPKASIVGFELMDTPRFGQTQAQERVNIQRALEGELTRTITSLAAVQAARVHLALPNQNGFFREQQKPSASVMLTLHAGRTLDRAQVAGIVHLVSSSVPELSPKAVSVLDQSGALLSESAESAAQAFDAQQLQYIAQVETNIGRRIRELLEPVVGADNLRATVAADIDFSQVESTAEQFRPNQTPDAAAVRSQQTQEQNNGSSNTPSGIPGAASNQPPVPATAPINGSAAPLQATGGSSAGGNSRREAVTNYELDKTVRVTRNASGTVHRINAAVVVNNRSSTDPKGKTTSVPLTPEELDKLNSLVQEAIGFSKERGDSVRVINAPFRAEPPAKVDEVPLWQQPWLQDLLRAGAAPAALALVGLVVVFGLVKPALKQAAVDKPAPVGRQLDAVVNDANELPQVAASAQPLALEMARTSDKLEAARAAARDNPVAVANVVRDWVGSGAN
jgi:flagellar M-ring protein FliF